jgi:hypothetical protein
MHLCAPSFIRHWYHPHQPPLFSNLLWLCTIWRVASLFQTCFPSSYFNLLGDNQDGGCLDAGADTTEVDRAGARQRKFPLNSAAFGYFSSYLQSRIDDRNDKPYTTCNRNKYINFNW